MCVKRAVVITGADGFIGSYLTRYFIEQSIDVYAIVVQDSPNRHRIDNIPGIHMVEGDLKNYSSIEKQLPKNPSAFFHLAWNGVSPETRNSIEIQQPNLNLCMDAVRLAASVGAQRFILPGSTMEYAYCGQKINANALPSPQNAYGTVKIEARYLCASMCEDLDIPYIYVVISGIYSENRQDNNVIFYTIDKLLKGERPIYTKLEQLWDYVHIDDLVKALYLIAFKGKSGAFYSIGHGDNWPLSNYIYQIRDFIDPTLPLGIGELPYKNGFPPSSCVDLTAIRMDTGFEPQIPFNIGIKAVIKAIAGDKLNESVGDIGV